MEARLLCLDEDTFLLGCNGAAAVRPDAEEGTSAVSEVLTPRLLSPAPAFRTGVLEAGPSGGCLSYPPSLVLMLITEWTEHLPRARPGAEDRFSSPNTSSSDVVAPLKDGELRHRG